MLGVLIMKSVRSIDDLIRLETVRGSGKAYLIDHPSEIATLMRDKNQLAFDYIYSFSEEDVAAIANKALQINNENYLQRYTFVSPMLDVMLNYARDAKSGKTNAIGRSNACSLMISKFLENLPRDFKLDFEAITEKKGFTTESCAYRLVENEYFYILSLLFDHISTDAVLDFMKKPDPNTPKLLIHRLMLNVHGAETAIQCLQEINRKDENKFKAFIEDPSTGDLIKFINTHHTKYQTRKMILDQFLNIAPNYFRTEYDGSTRGLVMPPENKNPRANMLLSGEEPSAPPDYEESLRAHPVSSSSSSSTYTPSYKDPVVSDKPAAKDADKCRIM
jgi:hypothetical protein